MVGKKIESIDKLSAPQILELVFENAIGAKANYIHIEPRDSDILIRYRVNGSLIELDTIPKKRLESIVEHIKKLSNLDAHVSNAAQDGRFKTSIKHQSYNLRVSIIPTIDGEKISINITYSSNNQPTLFELGYWGEALKSINGALKQKSGLILLTGPRDSGKSTSMLSMLSNISDPNIKIASIEDPVEYIIPSVNQTQVNHKTDLTFSKALKALEKHDSDIIMVSELRDTDTIREVFQHASRGRLIISSFYSNNIHQTLEKLIASGISRTTLAHSLRIISTQQLAMRLCTSCRVSFTPDKTNLDLLDQIFRIYDPAIMKIINKLEIAYLNEFKLNKLKENENQNILGTSDVKIKKLWKAKENGCDECFHTGYNGRVGLFEVIKISSAIEKLITSLATDKVLLFKAVNEGTISIIVDAFIKSLQGETSISEVYRVFQDKY